MDFSDKMHGGSELGFREYLEALEVERQKVQVFQRELPLCLELVTQTIERCKRQVSSGAAGTTEFLHRHQSEECNSGEQTTSSELEHGHVFEEFMPLKRSCSSAATNNNNNNEDEEEEQEHESPAADPTVADAASKKQDWLSLRSVQLWNDPTTADPPPPPPPQHQESGKKGLATEARKNGGGFQPFQKEKSGGSAPSPAPASDPAASSSGDAGGGGGGKRESKESQRKQRRNWSPELHKRFLNSLQQLGGSHAATPKQIRDLMKVDGLTNDEVKSHLQKYRLHTRRPAQGISNNGGAQTPQVVFVGGIWVQPSDYAAVAAAAAANSGEGMYAPVTAPTPHRAHHKRQQHPPEPEERASHVSEAATATARHSNSPATSSSTHTTTTSHAF